MSGGQALRQSPGFPPLWPETGRTLTSQSRLYLGIFFSHSQHDARLGDNVGIGLFGHSQNLQTLAIVGLGIAHKGSSRLGGLHVVGKDIHPRLSDQRDRFSRAKIIAGERFHENMRCPRAEGPQSQSVAHGVSCKNKARSLLLNLANRLGKVRGSSVGNICPPPKSAECHYPRIKVMIRPPSLSTLVRTI